MKGNYEKAKGNFDIVERNLGAEPSDPFCVKIKEFIGHSGKILEEFDKKLDHIKKIYAEACEYYLLDKGDEKCTNSQEFFKFFTGFFDQVIKSMPKEEKKRAAAKVGGTGGPARKIG